MSCGTAHFSTFILKKFLFKRIPKIQNTCKIGKLQCDIFRYLSHIEEWFLSKFSFVIFFTHLTVSSEFTEAENNNKDTKNIKKKLVIWGMRTNRSYASYLLFFFFLFYLPTTAINKRNNKYNMNKVLRGFSELM